MLKNSAFARILGFLSLSAAVLATTGATQSIC
jgi:hypothetical protein